MDDFAKDMNLIFSNCRAFNPPGTFPVTCADVVEKAFKKEWPKALERRLSWGEKRGMQGIMSTLVKDQVYVSFLLRVPLAD
jgi:transcription initiation factor TFIID subunit 2